uniref:CAP-Gly domain-containing protein n=1 Tax=Ascaris lumbricoides TaxID=6252 RepID=A0A0M3HF25_ASCLU
MDYHLLEEVECPADLFVFEDDLPHPRVGDVTDPIAEFRPSEGEQNPLRRPGLLTEELISLDSPAHDELKSFLLGDDASRAHTLWQARSPFQATLESFSPADEDMRYQLLEEIECPKDLFAFDDDLSNSRLNETIVLKESLIGVEHLPVVSDDTPAPAVEHGSSDERQRGLEEASPAKKIPLGADLGPHEGRDEFPLGNVTKIGVGVLRYVGSVKGKEGIFCGVELDLLQGRHNGTYQGNIVP